MLLCPQLAHDGAEDAGADRLGIVVDEHRRVRIEADRRAVGTVDVLRGPHDHGLVDVALLHAAPRRRFLDGDDDDVAYAGEAPLGAAQHLDALDALGAAIVGDLKVGLHLDHRSNSFSSLQPGKPGDQLQLVQASAVSAPATSASAAPASAGSASAFFARDFFAGVSSAVSGVAWVSTRPSTVQVFSFEIGRVSSMRTVSPSLNSLPSSWA